MRERMTRPLHKSQHKGRGKLRLVAATGARISEELATVDGTCRRFPLCGPDLHDAGSAAADTVIPVGDLREGYVRAARSVRSTPQ